MKNILVTGGCGFIGSNYVRHLREKDKTSNIFVFDKLTYSGNLNNIKDLIEKEKIYFLLADICNSTVLVEVMKSNSIDLVVHFAAESHVTRSETDKNIFYKTNVEGTRNLLDKCVNYEAKRAIHISTDEVYGSTVNRFFKEEDKLQGSSQASSVYAKSKSLADDIAQSYFEKLNLSIIRPTNTFGPYQYPEKALPRWITHLIQKKPIPVWGEGKQVRDWLYVKDLCNAIDLVIEKGERIAYNIAANNIPEITNVDLAKFLVNYFKYPDWFVKKIPDPRKDHDFRYALDTVKIKNLGWKPSETKQKFIETIEWYKSNKSWWQPLIEEAESIYK